MQRAVRLIVAVAIHLILPAIQAEARQKVSARISANLHSSADSKLQLASPGSACKHPRSLDQMDAERAYQIQRTKLDRHIEQLTEEEMASWSTASGWRIWELFPPLHNCLSKEKLGVQPADGGKFVCGVNTLLQHAGCTVFSFGSNGETSFEEDILNRTPCGVHTFDPTLDDEKRKHLEGIPAINLHEYGLSAKDGYEEIAGFNAKVKTLPSILGDLQVRWIDLLKIDVEGAEWKILENILEYYGDQLPFTQLQIEFHFQDDAWSTPPAMVKILKQLEEAGLRVFSSEYNFWGQPTGYIEYSFVNMNDCRVQEG